MYVLIVLLRGEPPDYFAAFAAAGRRNGTQRVTMLPLPNRSGAGADNLSPKSSCKTLLDCSKLHVCSE